VCAKGEKATARLRRGHGGMPPPRCPGAARRAPNEKRASRRCASGGRCARRRSAISCGSATLSRIMWRRLDAMDDRPTGRLPCESHQRRRRGDPEDAGRSAARGPKSPPRPRQGARAARPRARTRTSPGARSVVPCPPAHARRHASPRPGSRRPEAITSQARKSVGDERRVMSARPPARGGRGGATARGRRGCSRSSRKDERTAPRPPRGRGARGDGRGALAVGPPDVGHDHPSAAPREPAFEGRR
jgi:hypothetical protein